MLTYNGTRILGASRGHLSDSLIFLFYTFVLYLLKLETILTACSTGTASNVKSPSKSPIVASDNYQVTLTVIHKTVFIMSKQMFEVLPISSHTDVQLSPLLVDCLVDDMLQQTGPCMQQSGAASDQQRACMCGHALDTLMHGSPDFIVHWIQVETVQWPQCVTWAKPEVPQCQERGTVAHCHSRSFYKVQYEHIERDVVGGIRACLKFPEMCFCQVLLKCQLSKTFVGAPYVESSNRRHWRQKKCKAMSYAAANSSVLRCALKVVMVAELFIAGDGEFQTAGVMNALDWKLILSTGCKISGDI